MSRSKQKQIRDILLEESGGETLLVDQYIGLTKSVLLTEAQRTPNIEAGDKKLYQKKERTRRPFAIPGEFLTFDYRAKYPKGTKDHPYYDQFPFICVIKAPYKENGFLGSNVHYISNFGARSLRVKTLKTAVETGSLMVFENTIHHYLYDYVAGPLTAMPLDEIVSYGSLPLEQFVISDTGRPINKTYIWSQRTNWLTTISIKR